jgi:hypothetical protein
VGRTLLSAAFDLDFANSKIASGFASQTTAKTETENRLEQRRTGVSAQATFPKSKSTAKATDRSVRPTLDETAQDAHCNEMVAFL